MTLESMLDKITKAIAQARKDGDGHAYVAVCELCREIHVDRGFSVRCPKEPSLELDLGRYIARTEALDELGITQCVGCGCDDEHACLDGCYACSWSVWNSQMTYGICSSCAKKLEAVTA